MVSRYAVLVLALVMLGLMPANAEKPAVLDKWVEVWGDDFDGPNGTSPDSNKWVFDIGGGGWGNNELEYYTNRTQNAYLEDGMLVIQANKENYKGYNYTSARIKTQGKFSFTYGKVEMRAKLPYGQGIWPAFWLLGSDIDKVGWPQCGEIDIMEHIGRIPDTVYGTVHGPNYAGAEGIQGSYVRSSGFSSDYHVYGVVWEPGSIKMYVDDILYKTITPKDLNKNKWLFDKPFFILLNTAVGGGWPGNPDSSTVFPQKYYIDYVHVYKKTKG